MDTLVKPLLWNHTMEIDKILSRSSGITCLILNNRVGLQIVILGRWYDQGWELLERRDFVWSGFLSLTSGTVPGTERCPLEACWMKEWMNGWMNKWPLGVCRWNTETRDGFTEQAELSCEGFWLGLRWGGHCRWKAEPEHSHGLGSLGWELSGSGWLGCGWGGRTRGRREAGKACWDQTLVGLVLRT